MSSLDNNNTLLLKYDECILCNQPWPTAPIVKSNVFSWWNFVKMDCNSLVNFSSWNVLEKVSVKPVKLYRTALGFFSNLKNLLCSLTKKHHLSHETSLNILTWGYPGSNWFTFVALVYTTNISWITLIWSYLTCIEHSAFKFCLSVNDE